MNYYERHLGDYARDTAHLTMVEHGAYTLLLDRYYATERGIPDAQVHRLARARTDDERAAVDAVLSEFFVLVEGLWTHGRVEVEIEKASGRISAARENGRKGGRPRKEETHKKPSGFPSGYENETHTEPSEKLTSHQTPDTTNSERETHATDAGVLGSALRKAGCPSVAMSHPDFLAAVEEGVSASEAIDGVEVARANGVSGAGMWLYAIRTARSNHAKLPALVTLPGARAGPSNGSAPQSRTQLAAQNLDDAANAIKNRSAGLDRGRAELGLEQASVAQLGRTASA